MIRVVNMVVTSAGYRYIGHYRKGELKIVLEAPGCGVTIYPKDEFNLVKLFFVFGVDSEDGVMLESIKGRPCRVVVNEQGIPIMLQHIVEDKISWEVKQ